jgi:hypothetical protein
MANVTVIRTPTISQIGSYLTIASASSTYLTQTSASENYLTQSSASTNYLTQSSASTTYSTKDSPVFSGNATFASASFVGSVQNALNLNNNNIIGVNNLEFFDPGPNEGISWAGGNLWKIYESPDDLTTNSGGNLQFVQNATRRMTIDTGGRVLIPSIPAFSVYAANLSTQSGNLTYNSTNHNNGGHMNTSTGLFTAPVAGYYYFNYHGFVDQNLSGNTTITFQKNGSQIPSRIYNDENGAAYGPGISLSVVTFLAVNDNVRVNVTGAGMHGNDNSFFKGFLIG